MASQISNAMKNGANPQALMKQMMGNVDNNQMQSVLSQARSLGVPDKILQQIQNTR